MPDDERSSWIEFYTLYPFDDEHRYYRPAALIKANSDEGFTKLLRFLQPDPTAAHLSAVDQQIIAMFSR
jgi:hypothetical protein